MTPKVLLFAISVALLACEPSKKTSSETHFVACANDGDCTTRLGAGYACGGGQCQPADGATGDARATAHEAGGQGGIPAESGRCGDGTCSPGETAQSCPSDCGYCGNGACEFSENQFNCPNDCGGYCGDRVCAIGETASTCPADCRYSDGGRLADANASAPLACVDVSQLPATPVISFQQDLMPIFGLSCIASSCHDTTARKAGLVLGDPSACGPPGASCYDPAAKWKYSFKAPIPGDLLTTVYSALVNTPSMTVPVVKRVTPGDPSASFLLDSVMGTQNSRWYTPQCQTTDPARPSGPCGSNMPLGSQGLCPDEPDRVQAIAQWIAQGAQMN